MKARLRGFLLGLVTWAWASAAVAAVPCTLPFNLQNSTTADATQVMANYNAIVTCLGSAAASGVNSDITALLGLTTPLPYTAGGSPIYVGGVSTGTANVQAVVAPVPNGFSLTQGKSIIFIAGFTNTGATTFNFNNTGATAVKRLGFAGPEPLTGQEIIAGNPVFAYYDGTQYVLLDGLLGVFGTQTTLASATTTDLGTVGTHSVSISGTATITAFGSTATVTQPLYFLKFQGVLTLTQNPTSLILPGAKSITTAANDTAWALYLGSGNWQVVQYNAASGVPVTLSPVRGLIAGLGLSGGGSQTLTIASGVATSDDFTTTMTLGSTYTKTFSNWSVGSGTGGLDTGSIANNTWYHVFEINRPDTGVTDILLSTSATTPTLPTNYTKQRRIGSIKTDGTPNIITFFQNGDDFLWSTMPALDYNATNPGSSAVLVTLAAAPSGVRTKVLLNAQLNNTSPLTNMTWLISSPDVANTAPGYAASPLGSIGGIASAIGNSVVGQVQVWTNTTPQVRSTVATSNANVSVQLQVVGWTDNRGRFN